VTVIDIFHCIEAALIHVTLKPGVWCEEEEDGLVGEEAAKAGLFYRLAILRNMREKPAEDIPSTVYER
jgi:hypothetical protein